MNKNEFVDKLFAAAKEAGIGDCETYSVTADESQIMVENKQINQYSVSTVGGLSFRGLVNGKMGYASTEVLDDAAVAQLVKGVIESAELSEQEVQPEIFAGSPEYPEYNGNKPEIDKVTETDLIRICHELEDKALEYDSRIKQVNYSVAFRASQVIEIDNSLGLHLSDKQNYLGAMVGTVARDGEKVANESASRIAFALSDFDTDELVKRACDDSIFMLDASPVNSGKYRTIIKNSAMTSLLGTFAGMFSSENAQNGMSLLAGKEGQKIAADNVTIIDDPLNERGSESRSFDDEGVACYKKNVVEGGILKTLLYNLKTARKAGTTSTGNGRKPGYAGAVTVAPSNLYIAPGEKSVEELEKLIGSGIVICDVSGLHAGANMISGDFALIASGYTVLDGKKDKALNQVTLAGNMYELLLAIQDVGNDIISERGTLCCPSVYAGEMAIAGK
ncbi:MAG: TldD/PmbA family protein [Eubacteriales bacterium]|nr:TldD/PmbA family protein [Eubacteriales bacterium]